MPALGSRDGAKATRDREAFAACSGVAQSLRELYLGSSRAPFTMPSILARPRVSIRRRICAGGADALNPHVGAGRRLATDAAGEAWHGRCCGMAQHGAGRATLSRSVLLERNGATPMHSTDLRQVWSIVLAGGEGTRLRSLTRALHGEDRPKQYAFIHGDRSLLQSTLARCQLWSSAERSVVVVAQDREALARSQIAPGSAVDVISQPRNCGTGPGVLLPLCRVLVRDPEAVVVVLPSDHYVRDEAAFERSVRRAMAAAQREDGIVLVGAVPDSAETQYGWIVATKSGDGRERSIRRFWEKPRAKRARWLFSSGALWNTFVMVGSAARFWQLARLHLPAQAQHFDAYAGAVDTCDEQSVLERVYAKMPSADFSADLLQRADGLYVVPLEPCGWSDWGTPERVLMSLRGEPDAGLLEARLAEAQLEAARLAAGPFEAAQRGMAIQRLQAAALVG
jgi:mannose-1-phosphate guanylyltransferase